MSGFFWTRPIAFCPAGDVAAPINKFVSNACKISWGQYDGGQHAMDNLSDWAVSIATMVAGIAQVLAILCAPRSPGYSTARCGRARR